MSDTDIKWRLDEITRRLDRLDRRQDDMLMILSSLRGFAQAHGERMARLEGQLVTPAKRKQVAS